MRANNLISLLAVTAISFVAFASNSRGADASADEKALIKIEDEWGVAYVKRDTAYAERMTTADFTFVGPDGAVLQKAEFVKSIAGPAVFTGCKVDNAKVRFYGDTAVVIGLGSITAHLDKEDMSGKYS